MFELRKAFYILGILFAAVVCVLLCSCSKVDLSEGDMPYITFGVSQMVVETKGLIESLGGTNSPKVFVYGVRNNTEQIYNKTEIIKGQDNVWTSGTVNRWISGSNYSFYGYTYSPMNITNGVENPNPNCVVSNDGFKIEVTQPAIFNEENDDDDFEFVDYLFSHSYKVDDGANGDKVMLKMQHAMACVDIIVKREELEHDITVNSVSVSKIYRSAVMQCVQQANYADDAANNVWEIKLQGTDDVSYVFGPFTPYYTSYVIGKISFLAVPQELFSGAKLVVEYSVDEDNNDTTPSINYTQSFNLYNYRPYVWESGHKITYSLTINTGVKLSAKVSDWSDGGYIEGIILPNTNS